MAFRKGCQQKFLKRLAGFVLDNFYYYCLCTFQTQTMAKAKKSQLRVGSSPVDG